MTTPSTPAAPPPPDRARHGATAILLDLFRCWDAAGTCNSAWDHPVNDLSDDQINAACDTLVAEGLIVPGWLMQKDGLPNLTDKGRAALAQASPPPAGRARDDRSSPADGDA